MTTSALLDSSTPVPPPSYDKKCEQSAMSQVAMDQCAAKQVRELEVELTAALVIEAHDYDKKLVTAAQNSWTSYEVSECALEESAYKGGTIEPLIDGICERDLLVERIDQVRTDVSSHH